MRLTPVPLGFDVVEIGKTVLSIMVQRHYLEQVSFLLDRGAFPHIEDLTGRDSCDYAEIGDVHVFP